MNWLKVAFVTLVQFAFGCVLACIAFPVAIVLNWRDRKKEKIG